MGTRTGPRRTDIRRVSQQNRVLTSPCRNPRKTRAVASSCTASHIRQAAQDGRRGPGSATSLATLMPRLTALLSTGFCARESCPVRLVAIQRKQPGAAVRQARSAPRAEARRACGGASTCCGRNSSRRHQRRNSQEHGPSTKRCQQGRTRRTCTPALPGPARPRTGTMTARCSLDSVSSDVSKQKKTKKKHPQKTTMTNLSPPLYATSPATRVPRPGSCCVSRRAA